MEKRALMNKRVFFALLCFSCLISAYAQTVPDYTRPDAIAKASPDSSENSIASLSDYFKANLTSPKELIRAFYYWTANEIAYDVENMFTFRSSDNPATVISETLQKRKAVCQGYAAVFHELCENAGIESYVVLGYTKQNGNVVNMNHAWVIARPDTGWYFFDPTWGSGFITNGQFTRKFTGEYFMIKPASFIKSHMPFDPLWQCLFYPFSSGDFYLGIPPKKESTKYFNYQDSIGFYNGLSKPEKQAAALRRIEGNGVVNNSVFEYQRYLKQNLEIDRINRLNEAQNELVNAFNRAVNNYNSAAFLFNDYINYWNRQFKPVRPDAEIRHMLDTCDFHLAQTRKILAEIHPKEETLIKNMEMLAKPVEDIQRQVDEQKIFVREYLGTSKNLRPTMFRKYTWLGVPVK